MPWLIGSAAAYVFSLSFLNVAKSVDTTADATTKVANSTLTLVTAAAVGAVVVYLYNRAK